MTDFYSLKDYADGPHMVADPKGKWAWASDLAAVQAKIERLTKERQAFEGMAKDNYTRLQKAEAERDEARAQVAMLLEMAASMSVDGEVDIPQITKHLIRSLTPDDAKAALEVYGSEKVREGMRMAADIALCHSDDRPRRNREPVVEFGDQSVLNIFQFEYQGGILIPLVFRYLADTTYSSASLITPKTKP